MKSSCHRHLPLFEQSGSRHLRIRWVIPKALAITYRLKPSNRFTAVCSSVFAHAQISEHKQKSSLLFLRAFSAASHFYALYSPGTLITSKLEAPWKIWRAWIILNCPVHVLRACILHKPENSLNFLKHFKNFKSKHVHLDLIWHLNFDRQSPYTEQLKRTIFILRYF